jgi:hypothetical protein
MYPIILSGLPDFGGRNLLHPTPLAGRAEGIMPLTNRQSSGLMHELVYVHWPVALWRYLSFGSIHDYSLWRCPKSPGRFL